MKDQVDVSWRRSVGFVTKIRLSPRDVMSCIDAVNAVSGNMQGMSLSATVKKGIAIALETLRGNKVLPERDGYEYGNMIAPYTNLTRVEKIATGHKIVMQEQQAEINDAPGPRIYERASEHEGRHDPTEAEIAKSVRLKRFDRQRTELLFRKHNDVENFTKKDQAVLDRVEKEMAS